MTQTASRPRILWIDTARTVALLAMAVYHTGFDLEVFGRIPPGTMMEPGWRLFARLIAGTFIALAGLGHQCAAAPAVGASSRMRPSGSVTTRASGALSIT